MATFLEIVVIAFVAQLTVLPGEKVQLIIAGLSTRYRPLLVVGAAGTAFAGWTVLEILFGRALQQALPPLVLDLITAGLFLLFAVLLVRSAPTNPDAPAAAGTAAGMDTDGGVDTASSMVDAAVLDIDADIQFFGRTIGGKLGQFLSIFGMMAAGEFGDKTQLVTIGLAVQYGATAAICVGEMLAIIPVSLANAYFFHRFSHYFDARKAHYAGAAIFTFFGLETLLAITTGFSIWETLVGNLAQVLTSLV
jgi:putative Ca2+/H+ antiporter (TMEM165/GDT1 family)